jgi:WD40 repeat protein
LATSAADGQLILWDFAERRAKGQSIKHGGGSVAFSPDGHLLACIGVDLVPRVWDVASQQQVALLRRLGGGWTLAFTPDGTRILCGGEDHTLRVWNATGSPDKDRLKGHKSWVTQVAFSLNGRTLASVDYDLGITKLWDVPTRRFITNLIGTLGEHAGGGAAFSPSGRLLATSTYHGTVTFWDTATLAQIRVLTNDFGVASLAFSPDSKVLGVAAGLKVFRPNPPLRSLAFWDVAAGQKLNRLTQAEPDAVAVSFSRNGRQVAVGYFGGWVRLWDWETGAMIKEFRKHLGQVPTVAFSAKGNFLASGGEDDEYVVVYGVAPPRILGVLEGHTGGVSSVAFAPDDKTLAAAGDDGTIRLWSLATYQPVLTLKKHAGGVTGIAFTRDGNLLASCGGDGDVRLWPAPAFK